MPCRAIAFKTEQINGMPEKYYQNKSLINPPDLITAKHFPFMKFYNYILSDRLPAPVKMQCDLSHSGSAPEEMH